MSDEARELLRLMDRLEAELLAANETIWYLLEMIDRFPQKHSEPLSEGAMQLARAKELLVRCVELRDDSLANISRSVII